MSDYFQFEAEFIESMKCIPMAVRCKLDTCGIKLKLSEWNQFNKEERDQLFDAPCFAEEDIQRYREYLCILVQKYTQSSPDAITVDEFPAWLNSTHIPESLVEKAKSLDAFLSLEQWKLLNPLQRFALIKLSKPSHESKNFPHALREFGILS